jgi:hypothetical protein
MPAHIYGDTAITVFEDFDLRMPVTGAGAKPVDEEQCFAGFTGLLVIKVNAVYVCRGHDLTPSDRPAVAHLPLPGGEERFSFIGLTQNSRSNDKI